MNGVIEPCLVFLLAYIIMQGHCGATTDTVITEPEGESLNHCYHKSSSTKLWCANAGTLSCSNNTGRLIKIFTATLVQCRGMSSCNDKQCCNSTNSLQNYEIITHFCNQSTCSIQLPVYHNKGCLCRIQYNCTYLEQTTTHITSTSKSTDKLTSEWPKPEVTTSSTAASFETTLSNATTSSHGQITTRSPNTAATIPINSTISMSTKASTTADDYSNSSNNAITSKIGADSTPVAAIVVSIILVLVILAAALGAYCLRHKYTCCANYKTDHVSTAPMSNAAYIDQPDDGFIITKHPPSDYTGYSEIGPRVTSISYHANTDSLQPPSVTSSDYDVMTTGTRPVMPDPTYNHLSTDTPVYSRVVGKHADLTYDRIGGMDPTQTDEKVSFDGNIYNTTRLEEFAMDSSKPEKIFEGENVYDHAVNDQADCPRDTVTVNNDIPEDKNEEKSVKHEYFVLEKVQRDL